MTRERTALENQAIETAMEAVKDIDLASLVGMVRSVDSRTIDNFPDPDECGTDTECRWYWAVNAITYLDDRLCILEALAINSPGQGFTPRMFVGPYEPTQLTPRMGDMWFNSNNSVLSVFVHEWSPVAGSEGSSGGGGGGDGGGSGSGTVYTSDVQLTHPVRSAIRTLPDINEAKTQEQANLYFGDCLSYLDKRTIDTYDYLP